MKNRENTALVLPVGTNISFDWSIARSEIRQASLPGQGMPSREVTVLATLIEACPVVLALGAVSNG